MSINSLSTLKDKDKDTIPFRMEFIKTILRGNKLEPLLELENDNIETEAFIQGKNINLIGGQPSNDMRQLLNKKILDFNRTINDIGGKLLYIKSGSTGHTFKGTIKEEENEFSFAVKVVAYPKKEKYGDIHDSSRPENAELMIIRVLSYFVLKNQTPHIVLPIGTFNTGIKPFINLENENVVDQTDKKYIEFLNRYKSGYYYDTVSILISEWANKGDLLDFIRKNYRKFELIHWKVIFFQIISVLAVIQSKFPSFRHNDLKANNILVHKNTISNSRFIYQVCNKSYYIPNISYQIKLWDFDFACIPGIIKNAKVEAEWCKKINVTPVQNRYYDIHYFFSTLIRKGFFPQFMEEDIIPIEAKQFVDRIVPKQFRISSKNKLVSESGRILINDEYTTPEKILCEDPFFEEFRKVTKPKINRISEDVYTKLNSNLERPQTTGGISMKSSSILDEYDRLNIDELLIGKIKK